MTTLLQSCSFLLLTVCLAMGLPSSAMEGLRLAAAPSDKPALQDQAKPTLAVGVPLERDILGGETHEYELPVSAGTFLFLEIQPAGRHVEARLLGPDKGTVAIAVGREGAGTTKLLALITDHGGDYGLSVTALKQQTLRSRYRLTLRAMRPAETKDAVRVKALKLLAEGRHLRFQEADGSLRLGIEKFREALTLWKSLGDGRGEAETLTEIAGIQGDLGEWTESLRLYQEAIERSRASHYPEGEAWALGNMAFNYLQTGQVDLSTDLYEQSLKTWQEAGRAYELSFVYRGLGRVWLRKGDDEAALQSYQKAFRLGGEAGDPVGQANALSGIGNVHYRRGNLSDALKAFEQSLELSRAMGEKEDEAISENNVASIYYRRGQLQKAVLLFTELIGRIKDEGVLFSNLGAIYLELGDPEKALESYERARAAYRKAGLPEREASALTAIGWTRQRMGSPQEALAACDEAKKILPEESWNVAHFRGLALLDLNQLPQALESLVHAVKIAKASNDPNLEASSLLAVGTVYQAQKESGLAADQYSRAIELGRTIEAPSIVAPALLRRASLLRDQGQSEKALIDIEAALQIVESTRRNIAGQQIRTAFFASKQSYYEFYVDLLMQLAEAHPEKDYRVRALEASERAHARGLLDLLAEGRIDVSQGLDADLKEKEDRLSDELAKVQTELRTASPGPERSGKLKTQLDELDRQREQLDWEIRDRNPRYAQVRYSDPLSLREIQALLDEKTALFEYSLGERRSVLFVVTRESLRTYELPPANTIAEQVLRLRKALERESPLTRATFLDSAFQLYQGILAPAREVLGQKSELIIVPDRDLYYIPFEAVLTEDAGGRRYEDLPYLLRSHSITYVPSGSVLAGLRESDSKGVQGERLVAFAPFANSGEGHPSRSGSGGVNTGPWSSAPLPASQREVAGIAALHASTTLQFLNDEATEENVKQNPVVAAAGRLHFATHASPDERHPEYSALVLARTDGSSGDGLLQAHEIFNLKLSADLVVLSACQTALGKQMTGEGLIGLTRAFFYAGVPSLVVSLWNVTDGPTPDLMLDFYRGLDQSGDKAKALQSAKLAMIRRGTYSHPAYWAPFVLLGRPR